MIHDLSGQMAMRENTMTDDPYNSPAKSHISQKDIFTHTYYYSVQCISICTYEGNINTTTTKFGEQKTI